MERVEFRGQSWSVADARFDEAPGNVGSHWHLTLTNPSVPDPHTPERPTAEEVIFEASRTSYVADNDAWRRYAIKIAAALRDAGLLPSATPRARSEILRDEIAAVLRDQNGNPDEDAALWNFEADAIVSTVEAHLVGLAGTAGGSTDELIEVLQFYANDFNWMATVATEHPVIPTIIAYADRGERARAALASQPKEGQPDAR